MPVRRTVRRCRMRGSGHGRRGPSCRDGPPGHAGPVVRFCPSWREGGEKERKKERTELDGGERIGWSWFALLCSFALAKLRRRCAGHSIPRPDLRSFLSAAPLRPHFPRHFQTNPIRFFSARSTRFPRPPRTVIRTRTRLPVSGRVSISPLVG